MTDRPPLGVLDLVPLTTDTDTGSALRDTVDLVQAAERFGYARYWFAEHHLNPGVLGSSPTVVIALVAGATSTIRLGAAGVQLGHRTPLSAVEEFGLIDALYPGRLDLGVGRSFSRPAPDKPGAEPAAAWLAKRGATRHDEDAHTEEGLVLPRQPDLSRIVSPERIGDTISLLQQPGGYAPDYATQIAQLVELLDGSHRAPSGRAVRAVPGEGADVQVWILGASGGESATVAGRHGLRFVASYHHSPSTVVDAVTAYREAFVPSGDLHEPYVAVSVDAVVAPTDDEARELASGYAPWVRSIRRGEGAIAYPSEQEVARIVWEDGDEELVRDRLLTQFVGSPGTVADRIEQLVAATGAAEVAVTTITHRHDDRVRSYGLLAEEWDRRG